jgi:hypothetical protein
MRRLVSVLLLALGVSSGCGGSGEKPDNSAWETRKGWKNIGTDESGEVDTSGSKSILHGGHNWTGVRHDLAIAPEKVSEAGTCSCLAVAVGHPNDGNFVWRGPRPEVNTSNMAVAITAMVPECPGGAPNPADRRASISAVDRIGKDVVVEVEEVPSDRPLATGAIISPLEPGGHVYIRPRNKKVPYARRKGKELCRVK